ncbi:hypothetical protein KBB68_02265 [Candidatus Babeliales bacterium]|nr:hypothetical protein [Candidatus Babeliales bacterium]
MKNFFLFFLIILPSIITPSSLTSKTVHQETFQQTSHTPHSCPLPPSKPLTTPPVLSLPTRHRATSQISTSTQTIDTYPLRSELDLLRFIEDMFDPTSKHSLMKIQNSRIRNLTKVTFLVYASKKQSKQHTFSYETPSTVSLIQENAKSQSFFDGENDLGIKFSPNFTNSIFMLIQNSHLKIPLDLQTTCFKIITAQTEGILLREQNGILRYVP